MQTSAQTRTGTQIRIHAYIHTYLAMRKIKFQLMGMHSSRKMSKRDPRATSSVKMQKFGCSKHNPMNMHNAGWRRRRMISASPQNSAMISGSTLLRSIFLTAMDEPRHWPRYTSPCVPLPSSLPNEISATGTNHLSPLLRNSVSDVRGDTTPSWGPAAAGVLDADDTLSPRGRDAALGEVALPDPTSDPVCVARDE
jgi:hypothetical protein